MEYENDSAITISGDDEMAIDMRKIIWIRFQAEFIAASDSLHEEKTLQNRYLYL